MVNYLLDDVFGSLADATRRDMLQRLLIDELTVSQLAETYKISLPAVSKHVRVLEASGLVKKEKRGRQYFVHLTPTALKQATEHLQRYEAVLHNRLDSFGAYLRQQHLATPPQGVSPAPSVRQQAIVVTSILEANPETAWSAYIEPASIMQWWTLPGAQLVAAENEVEVGGNWRFTVRGHNGHTHVIGGTYSTVEHPHRLEYTDGVGEPEPGRPEARVTITLEQLSDGKTLVTKTSWATPAVHQLNAAWLRVIGGS